MSIRTIRPSRSTRCVGLAAPVLALLAVLALPAHAGEVYQWKDAKGVTHYSDSPPPAQEKGFKKTRIEQAPPAAAAPAEDPRCTIARTNLERIKAAKGPIGLDEHGDGKPDKEMNEEQIAYQVHLAQATVKNTCAPPVATQ